MLNVHDMNLLGTHNYENVCAAIAMTKAAGIPDDIIVQQVKKFKAVEHRIEYVATKNDVWYYNDSKGTNPEASVKAIEAMVRPTILIGGGYDKGSEFDMYVKAFKGKVKKLVLIGQTANKIAQTCDKYGFKDYVFADNLKEVVDICAASADKGDAVLLSPACASWGMFKNSLVEPIDDAQRNIYDIYMDLLKNSGHEFDHPEVMIYMIIEMVAGSCYNVILTGEPVSVDELKPYLYQSIRLIIQNHIL